MKDKALCVSIDKSAHDVFEYTLNPENTPKWIDGIIAEETNETPPRLGTVYRNKSTESVWNEYKMTAFEQDVTFTLTRLDGDYNVRYTFESTEDNSCEFEYYEWVNEGELDDTVSMGVLKKLKATIEAEH